MMRIVAIFGAPGVGKLTTARELAKLTGFKLIDNHTTIDWALRFFEFGSEPFWRLESRLRDAVFDVATASDVSLIGTFLAPNAAVMAKSNAYREAAERTGGGSCYVQLTCERPVLEQRVQAPGRAEAGKLTSVEGLRRLLARPDFALEPPPGTLVIDNTNLQPVETAFRIAAHFALPGS